MNERPQGYRDRIASAGRIRHVFVRDLQIYATLGVHEHEKRRPQRIIINVDLSVEDTGCEHGDDPAHIVDYGDVVERITNIAQAGHVNLVETLAERICESILTDARVSAVRVRIEKPDIIAEAGSVGIEIERTQTPP